VTRADQTRYEANTSQSSKEMIKKTMDQLVIDVGRRNSVYTETAGKRNLVVEQLCTHLERDFVQWHLG